MLYKSIIYNTKFTIKMDDKTEYFICDCVYHKKGFILCEICEQIINEDNKNDDGFVKVKRWKNSRNRTT